SLHGRLHTALGDYERARKLFTEGLELARSGPYCDMIAFCAAGLGYLEARQRNFTPARQCYRECLSAARTQGDKLGLIEAMEALAGLAAAEEKAGEAGMLWGAALTLRNMTRSYPIWENDLTRPLREGNKPADTAAFEAAHAEGRSWTLEK